MSVAAGPMSDARAEISKLTRLRMVLTDDGDGSIPTSSCPSRDLAQLKLGTPPGYDVCPSLAAKHGLKVVEEILGKQTRGLPGRGGDEDLGLWGRSKVGVGVPGGRGGGGEERREGAEIDSNVASRLVHLDLGRSRSRVRILLVVSEPLFRVLNRPRPACEKICECQFSGANSTVELREQD